MQMKQKKDDFWIREITVYGMLFFFDSLTFKDDCSNLDFCLKLNFDFVAFSEIILFRI